MRTTFSAFVIAFLFLCVASQTMALSTDKDKPADIEADDIEFDFKNGIRTYNKNVIIVQGTLRIKADKLVTLYDKDGELTEATATGSLARFKQRPDDKPDDVEGQAERIVVDQVKNTLTLYGQAALKSGADTARGETIIYDMANDTLKVRGGADLHSAGEGGQAATPERKLEDPFKDEPTLDSPQPLPTSTNSGSNTNSEGDDNTKTVESKPEIAPASSGRSRLIIQPK